MANYTKKELQEELKRRKIEQYKLKLLELKKVTDAQLRQMLKNKEDNNVKV